MVSMFFTKILWKPIYRRGILKMRQRRKNTPILKWHFYDIRFFNGDNNVVFIAFSRYHVPVIMPFLCSISRDRRVTSHLHLEQWNGGERRRVIQIDDGLITQKSIHPHSKQHPRDKIFKERWMWAKKEKRRVKKKRIFAPT